jgi:hypothetical protein
LRQNSIIRQLLCPVREESLVLTSEQKNIITFNKNINNQKIIKTTIVMAAGIQQQMLRLNYRGSFITIILGLSTLLVAPASAVLSGSGSLWEFREESLNNLQLALVSVVETYTGVSLLQCARLCGAWNQGGEGSGCDSFSYDVPMRTCYLQPTWQSGGGASQVYLHHYKVEGKAIAQAFASRRLMIEDE